MGQTPAYARGRHTDEAKGRVATAPRSPQAAETRGCAVEDIAAELCRRNRWSRRGDRLDGGVEVHDDYAAGCIRSGARRLAGDWSITVRANWRIILRFEQGDATDVDLIDYH